MDEKTQRMKTFQKKHNYIRWVFLSVGEFKKLVVIYAEPYAERICEEVVSGKDLEVY